MKPHQKKKNGLTHQMAQHANAAVHCEQAASHSEIQADISKHASVIAKKRRTSTFAHFCSHMALPLSAYIEKN